MPALPSWKVLERFSGHKFELYKTPTETTRIHTSAIRRRPQEHFQQERRSLS